MKLFRLILITLIISFPGSVLSQQPFTATREDGRKVLLFPDGTWRLVQEYQNNTPASQFFKPKDAKLFVKAAKGSFGVWIQEDKWSVDSAVNAPDPIKVTFTHKKGDAYAMVISERIIVPTETLKAAALANAKQVAPDIHVVSEETRIVNGKPVLCLQMDGTSQGIAFCFYGYYYGGPEGTLQVVTYTGKNLFNEFKLDFEDFLNGTQIGQ